MILLLQENCCCSIAVVFFLVADSEHQGVATVFVWPLSVLVFNCQLEEFLVVIILIGGVHLKFLCDTRTLEVLGLWTLHVLIYDVLELVFCCLRHLSSLFSHINVLKSSLAVQLSKVSIFGCPVRITNIRLLRRVLMDVPLVNVFLPVIDRQDDTLTLMQSKDITEVVLTHLIYHLIFCVHLIGVNECRMGLLLKLEMGKWVKRCCVILLVHFKFTIISAIVLIANRQVAVNSVMRLLLDHSVWINNSIELAKAVIV